MGAVARSWERELLFHAEMENTISAGSAWRSFACDQPGQRFIHHYQRSQRERSIAKTVLRIGLGTALLAGGVLLWVLPGPGWLLVMFGMAMFSGESRRLAGYLDRAEIFLRGKLRSLRLWWRSASPAQE